jgi:AcrR family transcriptional regulator
VSPQRSNRDQLIEGALRCLERLPAERITARAIADESGANLASIGYHFGSKDDLVTAAVIEGLDRWLDEIERMLGDLESKSAAERFRRASFVISETRQRHTGLAQTFFSALAKAPHDTVVRDQLAEGFRKTRPAVAALLELGEDQAGLDAAGLALAQFYGLLLQALLDPALAIDGDRLQHAQRRLLETTQVIGYPEGQLPTTETMRGDSWIAGSAGDTPQKEKLDHGCAQAQDVACEHP